MNNKYPPLLILALLIVVSTKGDDIATLKARARKVEKELIWLESKFSGDLNALESKHTGANQDIEAKIQDKKEELKNLEGQIDALEVIDQSEIRRVEEINNNQ